MDDGPQPELIRRPDHRSQSLTSPSGHNSARKVGENGQYSYVGLQKPCGQDRRLALLHGILGPLSNISLNGAGMSVPTKGICRLTDRYRLGHLSVRISHLVEHLFTIYNVPPLD